MAGVRSVRKADFPSYPLFALIRVIRGQTSLFMDDLRLDKWLWSVRVFKTRPEATAACRAGKVLIGELEAKPGRDVHIGETVTARVGVVTRTLKVVGLPRSRVGAKQLPEFMQDLTPAAEYERAKQAGLEHMLARERGRGRPTKKDRRDMSHLFGFE
jgi:ribosome-associated heat shock protein Hsp15